MLHFQQHDRRAMSINEVMVALGIVAVGVTSIVSLFPLGIMRVQQAVYDTRCTLMARDAKGLLIAKQMPNDPLLWRWDLYDPTAANPNTVFDILAPGNPANNRYACLHDDTNPIAGAPDQFLSGAGATLAFTPVDATIRSYPILVDPFLADPDGTGVPAVTRLDIETYCTTAGIAPAPYAGIRVLSTAECLGIAGFAPFPNPAARQAYMTRWFAMPGDLAFDDQNPVLPFNPRKQAVVPPVDILDYARWNYAAVQSPTASRTFPYSWAFMIQRNLDTDPDPNVAGGNQIVARPPMNGDYADAKIRYLCFQRRNPNAPVVIIEACIFDGSSKVTLSWPTAGVTAPTIRRGTWLMEASITRNTNVALLPAPAPANSTNLASGTYNPGGVPGAPANVPLRFRRDFEFYRVVDYSDAVVVGGRFQQVVQVSPLPSGYPTTSAVGDLRAADPYPGAPVSWPLNTNAVGGTPNQAIFYPVVILDGLQEVY